MCEKSKSVLLVRQTVQQFVLRDEVTVTDVNITFCTRNVNEILDINF